MHRISTVLTRGRDHLFNIQITFGLATEVVSADKLDEAGVIYTKLGQDKVSRKILIPKTGPKNVDLLLPWSSFVSRPENEMFVVRKIKDDFFLTKIVLTK